jgi:hypothetical protein
METLTTGARSPDTWAPVRAVAFGGLLAGTLDILDAFFFTYARRGVGPDRVLQAVASGMLGRSAFDGGHATALLGLALHFFIALVVAGVYTAAARVWPMLVLRPAVCGIAYGAGVYFFMQHIVLPLSAVTRAAFSWPSFVNGVLIHALGVGLPIAVIARRFGAASVVRR